ncbi:MAG: MerR family transcriptional regulator [Pseudomonadota bacterium]
MKGVMVMNRMAAESIEYHGEVVGINKLKTKHSVSDQPVYSLKEAAELLHVHPQTLRKYQSEGLVKPVFHETRWMFSQKDILWTKCLRSMIHQKKLSIPGLKKLLHIVPCWMAATCPAETHCHCQAQVDWSQPRRLQLVSRCSSSTRSTQDACQTTKKDGAQCRI